MAYETDVCILWFLVLYMTPSLCIRAPMKDGKIYVLGKITGGNTVPLERFSYSAQLFNSGSMCGGTILSSWTVMTAALCFDRNKDIDEMELDIGSRYTHDPAADRYNVWYFVLHDDYNKSMPFACDVALIFVTKPITFSSKTSRAVLVNTDKWMFASEANFTTSGWGWTTVGGQVSKFGMMMTDLQFVSSERCRALHNIKLTPDMFCMYGDGVRDSCKGDSGGGVEWKGMIVGIVSHGDGCAVKDRPSVYANVWYFRGWIEDKMEHFTKHYCHNKVNGENTGYTAKNH